MVNALNEAITDKTITQYKIIEDKYEILCYYLRNFFADGREVMLKEDVDLIISSLNKICLCTAAEEDITKEAE